MRRVILTLIALLSLQGMGEAGYSVNITSEVNAQVFSDNTTTYTSTVGVIVPETIEAYTQRKVDNGAGTFSKAKVNITANDVSSASTLRFRKDTANGNIAVSITGNTTGLFEDNSNTDAVVSTNLINWAVVVPSVSGAHDIQINNIYVTFLATSNTSQILGSTGLNYWSLGTSYPYYAGLYGRTANTGTQPTQNSNQIKFYTAGDFTGLGASVSVYGKSVPATVGVNINTTNGSNAISINGTGIFLDTSNTDSISSGDLICFSATGSGTGEARVETIFTEFTSTTSKTMLGKTAVPIAHTAATTYYYGLGGGWFSATAATEGNNVQIKSTFAANITNLQIYLTANAATGNGTFTFRKGGADTSLTTSVTASTTGLFEDTSNSVSVAVDDLINYKFVVGSGGTSTVSMMGSMIEDTTGGGPPATEDPFPFIGGGFYHT